MKIKVLTLNIWRYYNWENRKEDIIKFIKEQNADIVFLQEVAYDVRLKDKWKNQVHELNEQLKYIDFTFDKLMKMTKWHKEEIDWEMYFGLGILTKYPIKKKETILLPPIEKDKNLGFAHIVIETPKGNIDLINVHFENTNKGSKEHLKQMLLWCKERDIKPIIAGDFNMKIIEDLFELSEKDYNISYKIKQYKSFYPTAFSHDKTPITLDYILTNKEKLDIESIECLDTNISDHKPITAIINLL